jgi:hypothetical protein
MPDAMECLAFLAVDADSYREAARLFGAAEAMRQRSGEVRFLPGCATPPKTLRQGPRALVTWPLVWRFQRWLFALV